MTYLANQKKEWTLPEIVGQLAICDYQSEAGALEHNAAFIALCRLAAAEELEQPEPDLPAPEEPAEKKPAQPGFSYHTGQRIGALVMWFVIGFILTLLSAVGLRLFWAILTWGR